MKTITLVVIILIMFTVQGCWKQHDVISIKKDGSTTFETEVTITEKGMSFKDIDQLSSEFMSELRKAGWNIERKWLAKSEPYQLKFTGQGNLRSVGSAADFYKIRRNNDNSLDIQFIPATSQGGKSSRSIKFNKAFIGGAKVIDNRGNEI